MNHEETIRRLREPFSFELMEIKVQVTNGDKTKGLAVFYLDARVVQERLDTVLGPFGWRNEYLPWQDKAQVCGLSIYNTERGEWVTKYDGAENSDIESVKGGLSDAFKRACVLWGVGRYLYQIDGVWVDVESRGKGHYIKENQQPRLKTEYDRAVARIFGTAAPRNNKTADAKEPLSDNNQPPTEPLYKVKSAKASGKRSQMLELLDRNGEVLTAYVKASDTAIKPGVSLRNVSMEQKESSYGKYQLLVNYEIAA